MQYQIHHLPLDKLPPLAMKFSLYCQPDFLAAFASAYQAEVFYLATWNGTEYVACMPVFERKKLGFLTIINPQLYYYHFLSFNMQKSMHPNRIQQRKLDILEAISHYMQKNYHKVLFNLNPEIQDIRGFTWTKMKAIPLYTYLVSLKNINSSHFFVNERNSIHKAEREGVTIAEFINYNEFIRLMKMTNQRQGRELALSEEQHIKLLQDLFNIQAVRQFNALIDNKIIAVFLVLQDHGLDTVYAWQHYTDPAYFNTGVSPFFFNTLFNLLKDDFSTFDLCGANHPAISRYKAALGANLQVFFRIQGNMLTWK